MKIIRFALLSLLLGAVACSSGLGEPCQDPEDCRGIELGYCAVTGICVALCSTDGDACGDGLCSNVGGRLVCLPPCDSDDDCRPADSCSEVTGGRACVLTEPLEEP